MFKTVKIISSLLLLVSISHAEKKQPYDPARYNQATENKNYQTYNPIKEKLDLGSKSWKIRSVIEDDRKVREELKELGLLKIRQKPLIKKMVDMDSLEMHPEFPLVIFLPQYAKITSAYCYPPTVKAFAQFNRVDLIPSKELLKSTLVITYINNNHIETMSILISKIKNSKHSLLSREIKYQEIYKLDVEEVLSEYFMAHNRYPKNGSMIRIGKQIYTFIRDDVNGVLRIDGRDGKYIMNVNQD